MQVYINPN